MKKASTSLEIILKASDSLKKASVHYTKASIPLKSLVIFIKALNL
jgi:hypothetical protein